MAEGTEGKASSGAKFRPPPANIWNSMIDAGVAFQRERLSQPGQERIRPRETDILKIKNDSGTARRRGEILRIDDGTMPLDDLVDEFIWLKGVEPTIDGYFGILKDPAAIDAVEKLQVSGACIAIVDITDATHKYAKAVATEYVVASSEDGPLEILYAPDGEGEKECVVRFSGGGGGVQTAFALISESGKHDEFQSVTLKRSASPDTFTESTCGGVTFDDMQFNLFDTIGVETVLVPAGYKAGEAMLVKFNITDSAHAWSGWVVVAGPTLRCAVAIPTKVECCPTTQLIKFTEFRDIWYFGGQEALRTDACPP